MRRSGRAPPFRVVVRELSADEPHFEVCAYSPRRDMDLGCVEVELANFERYDFRRRFQVAYSWVLDDYQRRGIATRLYERAAAESCRRGGPLQSDVIRSGESDSFWHKQWDKGRAEYLTRDIPDWPDDDPPDFFRLRCPPPSSLAKPTRR